MRVVIAAAVGTLGAAACLFPSLDGLNGGDAAIETGTPEAGGDSAQKPTTFCSQSTARFCEDFDDSDATAFAQWPLETQQNGASVIRDPSDASAPFGARFLVLGLDAGDPFGALEHDFTVPITTSARLAFDLRVDEFPAYGQVKPIATIQFDASLWPNVDDCVGLALTDASGALFECVPTDAGSTYPWHNFQAHPTLGKWMHVEIVLTFAPGDITATLLFDGATVLPQTTLDSRITYAAPALQLGAVAMDPRASASFVMDNVTLDFQ